MDIDINEMYSIANRITSKELSKDLVHHVYVKLNHVTDVIKDHKAYFITVMKNEVKPKGEFYKKYLNHTNEITDIKDEIETPFDLEGLTKSLDKLEMYYDLEVSVFKDIVSGTSKTDVSKKTGLKRDTVTEIYNFVKQKLKQDVCSNFPDFMVD